MSNVLHLQENKLGKDYIVGDIHGCFHLLKAELEAVSFDEAQDRLFSVGDLVDRGPNSEDCLEWLAKPWFYAVRGNHEQMAIDYVAGMSDDYYSYNGGQWMIELAQNFEIHAQRIADKFTKLPIAMDITVGDKTYGIVHAECPVDDWSRIDEALDGKDAEGYANMAMWSRDRYNYKDDSVVQNVEIVYVGHTPLKEVKALGNVLYIDTGACFEGGKLTLLEMY